jgi:threonylcarbamoyladenosine tRNA methylthiotransferase MtaB
MRRGYTAAGYEERIARARERLPDATFGADVIVGFPGEDEAAFRKTCDLVERIGFANLHVFRYSPRAGTDAARLPGAIPERVKRARAERLDAIRRRTLRRLLDNRISSTQDVLVEECRNGQWLGYTRDYIHVSFESATPIPLGLECPVRITEAGEERLEGVCDDRDDSG